MKKIKKILQKMKEKKYIKNLDKIKEDTAKQVKKQLEKEFKAEKKRIEEINNTKIAEMQAEVNFLNKENSRLNKKLNEIKNMKVFYRNKALEIRMMFNKIKYWVTEQQMNKTDSFQFALSLTDDLQKIEKGEK
jgi:hypothetical protein